MDVVLYHLRGYLDCLGRLLGILPPRYTHDCPLAILAGPGDGSRTGPREQDRYHQRTVEVVSILGMHPRSHHLVPVLDHGPRKYSLWRRLVLWLDCHQVIWILQSQYHAVRYSTWSRPVVHLYHSRSNH